MAERRTAGKEATPRQRVVAAVIGRDGRYLLTLRPDGSHMASYWEFPGGKLEPGERPGEALRRELREEIGVDVEPGEELWRTEHRYPDRRVELLFLRARIVRGVPRPLEVAALGWFRPEQMPELPLLPADLPLAERLRGAAEGER
ncbi:MAG: (deoxy)nucleoside triphosphate pyrophosphohydrolase [Acidobacteria bacterium]|nr:MAG: (deoxy)nucleoside triphosphate pyrophosphohydrolase [Acidobacteriota bacterium]